MEVLNSIPVVLDPKKVLKRLRMRKRHEHVKKTVQELIEVVRPIARPKAVYEVCYVDNKNGDSLNVGGIKFTSRVLRVNLDKAGRVFPYVITCGKEVDEITVPASDFLKYYCLDKIKEMLVRSARDYLKDYLQRNYALPQLSAMNPGSLKDWPITQQKELFSIFGNVEELIGVKLTEALFMVPLKSVSGIFFPTQVEFISCQLCPREVCEGRKAPYTPDLAKKYKGKSCKRCLTATALITEGKSVLDKSS